MVIQLRALLPIVAVIGLAGCGEDEHEVTNIASYQACFDQHHDPGVLTPVESIVECCLDHKIMGARYACGMTIPDCINYITNNLNQLDASTVEVMDACAEYFNDLPPGSI